MNMKDKTKLFNIPNCLCYFRILLIPVFLFVYFNAQWQHHYIIAAFILVLSGISDCLDGYIARKYNMITDFGKLIDPIADKLTQLTIVIYISLSLGVINNNCIERWNVRNCWIIFI